MKSAPSVRRSLLSMGVLAVAFGLEHAAECARARDDGGRFAGFLDGSGGLAVESTVGVVFESTDRATAHFGGNVGVGFGAYGWRCPFQRGEDGAWRVVSAECMYYDT